MDPDVFFIALLVAGLRLTDAVVPMTVTGLVPAVYTPMDKEGQLNFSIIPNYAEYLKNNNINGILLSGTSGEGPSLTLEERKQLLYAWLKECKPRGLKVVVQVGGQPLPDVLEMAQYSESVGADAILCLPELFYRPPTDSILVNYLKMVSKAAPKLPLLYYHHPEMSHVTISAAQFFKEATSTIPNFKGMKCDFITALQVAASGYLQDDQKLFMTSHLTMASNVMMGMNTSMSAAINIYPKLFVNIQDAIGNSDVEKARQLQLELNERIAVIASLGDYVSYGKAAMGIVSGIGMGNTREPLRLVTDAQMRILEDRLQEIDLKYASN